MGRNLRRAARDEGVHRNFTSCKQAAVDHSSQTRSRGEMLSSSARSPKRLPKPGAPHSYRAKRGLPLNQDGSYLQEKTRMYFRTSSQITPRNGDKLVVGVVARISGC